MITKISKIKDFGLYQNYTVDTTVAPFKRINLIYGWNGSGKSTLSRIFRCFEQKQLHQDYPKAFFEIIDNKGNTHNSSFKVNPPIIKVFNTDFISDNLKLSTSKTEPIIYLSEEKIIEKEELDKLREQEQKVIEKVNLKKKEIDGINKTIDTFHKNAGKSIKDFLLGTIHADVTYNKATSEKIWTRIKSTGTSLSEFVKSDDILSVQKGFILLNSYKNKISVSYKPLDIEYFKGIQERVDKIAFKRLTNTVIERFKKEPILNNWAYSGLKLHKKLSSLKCEFCGQTLPPGRLNSLEEHFNYEFETMQTELKDLKIQLNNLLIPEQSNIKLELFDFLKNNYEYLFRDLELQRNEINEYINSWLKLVDSKINNPFITEGQFKSHSTIAQTFNSIIENLNNLITSHNKHVEDYKSLSDQSRIIIEDHFVAQRATNEDLMSSEGNLDRVEKELQILEKDLSKLTIEIESLELKVKNELIALTEINSNLSLFLGEDNIKLNPLDLGGYELQRNGETAKNISEGEKTAIALVYFMAKLKEQNNKIEDSIIVLDDPISSFDSNHLFHANYFIKSNCESAKQLFIFTHNFQFFTLLKEWALGNNDTEYYVTKTKKSKEIKEGYIENADIAIKYFSSEYHFLFSEIKKYIEKPDKSYFNIHVISNLSRQLLESFLTFKYGRKKLEKCFDEVKDFKDIDKVRKFVNAFSHRTDGSSSISGFNDNLFAEADKIVPLVLDLIKHLDSIHYNSMIARLNGS
jgi:wobble nucleotide-excising tRNase